MVAVDTGIPSLAYQGTMLLAGCAQLLILYRLSAARTPPPGLGLFTAFFMAVLAGWVLLMLPERMLNNGLRSAPVLVAGYLLFLACGQRLGWHGGRWLLGTLCLLACLGLVYLPEKHFACLGAGGTALFWGAAAPLAGRRAWRDGNAGDALIAGAGLFTVTAALISWWYWPPGVAAEPAAAVAETSYGITFLLVLVGFSASVSLEFQQRLARAATEDPLTGLFNRRGLGEALALSLASAARHQQPMSAIYLDLDHFQKVNDSFGADAGDQVLQDVAQLLSGTCRASDAIARLDSGEFLLVLPNTRGEDARNLAERICSQLAGSPFPVGGQTIRVTASLGVSASRGEPGIDQLADAARRAHHQARRAGGNRVASVEDRTQHFRSRASETGA